jgi:type IV pilus assembly protein PilY1
MNTSHRDLVSARSSAARIAYMLLAAAGVAAVANAHATDVAQTPVITSTPNLVKPNIMFILDDSGSMGRDHMPDDADFADNKYGFFANQCNGLAYDPAKTYAAPVDYTGASMATVTYAFLPPSNLRIVRDITSAVPTRATGTITVTLNSLNNGEWYVGESATLYSDADKNNWMHGTVTAVDSNANTLTINFTEVAGTGSLTTPRIGKGDHRPYYYTYNGTQPAQGYTYDTSGLISSSTFFMECNSVVGIAPGNGLFTKSTITAANITDNFRNWYTYHRTRMLTMRTAASLAFKGIDQNYRVGFSTISSTTVDGDKFLDSSDFTSTHKQVWYSRLFGSNPTGYTPLRGALSKAGQYYAKKGKLTSGSDQTYDPMQLSCQKNFAILTTDGYWNAGVVGQPGTETATFGPFKLDGTAVGQQDGGATPRPMFDGGTTVINTRTSDLQQRTVTPQWTTNTTTLQQRAVTPQWRTDTQTLQRRTGALQRRTSANSGSTWTAWANVSPGASSCAWDTSGSSRAQCQYAFGAWTSVASCTANASTGSGNGTTWSVVNGTECQYTAPVSTTTASCTAVAPSGGPNYTVGTATQCTALTPLYGTWTNAASCSASATMQCAYTAPVSTTTTSCSAVAQSTGPNYTVGTARQCTAKTPLNGAWAAAASCTASSTAECRYTSWTSWTSAASCTATAQSSAPNYTVSRARECQTLASGGTSDTLADVAMYYYQTDLRTADLANCTGSNGVDVCANNVNARGVDNATHQHMTTFTLGLGVDGLLNYEPNYLTASPDFQAVVAGTKDWPVPRTVDSAEKIDDLWHAAVNGRGEYFSAKNPDTLASSLRSTITGISALTGTAAAAATSSLQPTPGDSTEYLTSYKTVDWTGDVVARQIDERTGARVGAALWSAQQKLDARVAAGTARAIFYLKRSGSANTGTTRDFTYANLQTDSLNGLFDGACSKSPALTQCANAGYDLAGANAGANLVAYLRGGSDATRYRERAHLLSDVVGGAPVYVKKPNFSYTENGYATFAATNATRSGVVYVPSNGGMLHAFDAVTGEEKWAYVPTMVMDRMYRLADSDYANRHQFLINGAPVVGDVYSSATGWRTILVGGLGAGGRGYYALDITNPNAPEVLWEFTNDSLGGRDNLGLTFGDPLITKRVNGQWVVVFTSGYNNVSPGDGNGRLFVVNAHTGERLTEVQTFTSSGVPAGTTAAPSGLAKINGWLASAVDNTALRYYGGDLLGNLWRFDIDAQVAPNNAALRLATLSTTVAGPGQPITTKPELAEVTQGNTTYQVVYVATGKLLGVSDLTDTATQSVYAIKDPLTNTQLGDVRSSPTMVVQTLTVPAAPSGPRTITNNTVNWATDIGWRVDLPSPGERVNVDIRVVYQALIVASNIPEFDVCRAASGGSSFLYQFNINSGSAATATPGAGGTGAVAGVSLGNAFVVGFSPMQLFGGPGSGMVGGGGTTIRGTMSDGSDPSKNVDEPGAGSVNGRRTSWRELIN